MWLWTLEENFNRARAGLWSFNLSVSKEDLPLIDFRHPGQYDFSIDCLIFALSSHAIATHSNRG